MHMKTTFVAVAAVAVLTACGGGSASSSGGVMLPPTPTATQTPAAIAGKVVQLAGPLAADGTPTVQSTPVAGAGIGGATVYVTANVHAAGTSTIPAAPLATATTAPDGTFAITVPNGQYGVVVVDGSTIGTGGLSSGGYTQAHAMATTTTPVTLYLDTLTPAEQSGFAAYNAARAALGIGLSPISSDTLAEAVVRMAIRADAGMCQGWSGDYAAYLALGGLPPTQALVGTQPSTPYYDSWVTSASVAFPGQPGVIFGGFAGPTLGPACANSSSTLPQYYYAEDLYTD